MKLKIFKVSEITSYIKNILKTDIILNNIHLEGEISNYSIHVSGHIFFTLKDEFSKIPCVMYATDAQKINVEIKEGMNVQIKGRIDVYSQEGKYQVVATSMLPAGIAVGYQNFLILKEKLYKKGYFELSIKKPIKDVKKVGVITSERGAAIKDFLSVLNRRNPFVDVYIYPSLVQGENAPEDIARGVAYFNEKMPDLDAIVISRGGGSKEDLSAFNTEIVADAVFSSKIPIMSAVGHEIDISICDMCADVRAATPTEAAEYISGDFYLKLEFMRNAWELLNVSIDKRMDRLNKSLQNNDIQRTNRLIDAYFHSHELKLKDLHSKLNERLDSKILRFEHALERSNLLLTNFNPKKLLEKGFALVRLKEHYVQKAKDLKIGDEVEIIFSDRSKKAKITE